MRLRATALPIFLVTVNPNRAVGLSQILESRGFPSSRKAFVDHRRPPRARRKSCRFFSVTRAIAWIHSRFAESDVPNTSPACRQSLKFQTEFRPKAACALWHAAGRGCAVHPSSACAYEIHAGAFAPVCSVDRFFSRLRLQILYRVTSGTSAASAPMERLPVPSETVRIEVGGYTEPAHASQRSSAPSDRAPPAHAPAITLIQLSCYRFTKP